MRKIAVTNQKGGVGKTTSVINIGAGLHRMGDRVLVIDLDPQANLSYSLGVAVDDLELSVYDLLTGEAAVSEILVDRDGLELLPASIDLSSVEIELAGEIGRESLLKNALAGVSKYDYVFIDCPPTLGLLTLNALTVAEEVFVPMQPEYLSIKGLSRLMDMLEMVKRRINPDLSLSGILLTLYDGRLRLHNEVLEDVRHYFREKVFQTYVRRNVSLAEAASFGQTIYEYASQSHGAEDYAALCNEINQMKKQHV